MRQGLRRAILGLGVALLGACQPALPRAPSASPSGARSASPRGVAILLEHVSARDAWQVVVTLPRALPRAHFLRGRYPNRIAKWRVTTPGLAIVREGEEDVVRAADGHPFTTFTLDIATYADHPEKDYQVFVPYSDGSVLVYTGQLDVGASDDEKEDDTAPRTTFTFVPREGERVVVAGTVAPGARAWTTGPEGTYVYFGRTEPVVGEGFVGVVDGAMPAWLRAPIESLLPPVFRLYASRTGLPLTFRPMVFLSYRAEDASFRGYAVDGGTLPGLIQLEVRLDPEHQRADDERVREEVGRVVAHEVAHLWNGQMFHHETHAADWMHEGGADAFAYEALRVLGRIRPEHLREAEADAFSSCLLGTRLGPVRGADVPGRFKLFYWCGHLVTHLTNDPLGFWGRLFREAPGGVYGEEQLFAQMRGVTNGAAAENAARLVLTGSGDPVAAVLAADPRLGLTPKERPLSAAYQQLAGLVVATLVLRPVCGRDVAPRAEAGGLRIDGDCAGLDPPRAVAPSRGDAPPRILAQLAGHDLRGGGAAAYDAAVATCASQPTLVAGMRDAASATSPIRSITLPCPRPFTARPPHVTP